MPRLRVASDPIEERAADPDRPAPRRFLGQGSDWWARLGAAVASGLLLSLAYAPYDFGLIALVALIPLLWVWRDAGPGRAAWLGFVAGLAFFGVTISWTANVGVVAVVPFVVAESAYWAVTGALVGGVRRLGVRAPWITAAAWVLLEAARGRWPLGGFSWAEAGMALHDVSPARAVATFGGVPLLSFVVVAVNGLLIEAFASRRDRRAEMRVLAGFVAVVCVVVGAVAFRFEPRPAGRMRYALIQGNDQDRRLTQEEIDTGYLTERHLALAAQLRGNYDLIVFPESAFETDPEADPSLRARIVDLARKHNSAVLVNAITLGPDGKRYNTNRMYAPSGRLVGSYSKQHLVPFGEYVPWRNSLSFISELQQVPTDLTPGDKTVVFDVKGHEIGSVICFETAFAPVVRSSVRDGADIIVVSTNNRSYRHSALSAQQLAASQMRAAETARPVMQAAVSGITGVIDSSGRVIRTNPLFHNAVVQGTIETTTGDTPYVRYGDWMVAVSLLVLAGGVGIGLRRRRLQDRTPTPGGPPRSSRE